LVAHATANYLIAHPKLASSVLIADYDPVEVRAPLAYIEGDRDHPCHRWMGRLQRGLSNAPNSIRRNPDQQHREHKENAFAHIFAIVAQSAFWDQISPIARMLVRPAAPTIT
jgi:hypothetical protein